MDRANEMNRQASLTTASGGTIEQHPRELYRLNAEKSGAEDG
jgi:hypothetical protein